MRARVWGCRGSLAAPGQETVRYGGNTSCVEIRSEDGGLIVLDAGTGIRPLGLAAHQEGSQTMHLLLTHLHLDHIEGLGFFAPIWDPGTELHIWGPHTPGRTLEQRITQYFSPPLFPVPLSAIPALVVFHEVHDEAEWRLGQLDVRAQLVNHPGPTLAYRLNENGRSFAYVPDHEPARDADVALDPPEEISGHGLALGAELLFHDGQYTAEEYSHRIGWGHSAAIDAVHFARAADVGRLVLFHHDPNHSDDELEQLLGVARAGEWERAGEITLAHEGMELEL